MENQSCRRLHTKQDTIKAFVREVFKDKVALSSGGDAATDKPDQVLVISSTYDVHMTAELSELFYFALCVSV